jgi:TonB family protein
MPSQRQVTVVLIASLLSFAAACEKKSRTRNSGGSGSLTEGEVASAVPVYQFVSTEQTMTDARRAVAAEKWAEAGAAAEALLKEWPANAEAKSIAEQARLEAPNAQSYQVFAKATAANDTIGMAKAWRNIGDTSLYKERARPALDKAKATYVASQENDARNMARAGRCDDARRVVRVTAEYFPDVKGRLDDISAGCRPAREDKSERTEVASIDKRSEDRTDTAPLAAAQRPAPEPTTTSAGVRTADPQRTSAAVEPPPKAAPPAAMPPTAPAAAAPPPVVRPAGLVKKIPPGDLEGLRVAGDRTPSLPGNIKAIARRDGVKQILVAAEVCVGTDGRVSSAKLLKASDYDEANEAILGAIRQWKFRPYLLDGEPNAVCSGIVLPYAVEGSSRCGLTVTGVGCAQ